MNNSNHSQPNQQPWQQPSYIPDPRSQPLPRPGQYYQHYPAQQIFGEYMQPIYGYPPVMPTYRQAEYPIPPQNSQSYNSLGLMTPQAYAKYYSKVSSYLLEGQQYGMKQYQNGGEYYNGGEGYRGMQQYQGTGVNEPMQQQSQQYPNEQFPRVEKSKGGKDVIVIESDQDNPNTPNLQKPQTHTEEKPAREFNGKLQQPKHLPSTIPIQHQQTKEKETVSIDQQQKWGYMPVEERVIFPPKSQNPQITQKQPPIIAQHPEPQQQLPQSSLPQYLTSIVPVHIIDEMKEQILQQLENVDMPDIMMKHFIKFKTLETRSKYQEKEEISAKVFQLLRIYRVIIQFQKQRKQWMDNYIQQVLFGGFQRDDLKQSDFQIKKKQKTTNINHKTSIPQIFKQQNQRAMPRQQRNVVMSNRYRQLMEHIRDQNRVREQRASNRSLSYREIAESLYPQKSKKIMKQDSSQNSEEHSFTNPRKGHLYEKEPVILERRLRDRKKKKNKKEKFEEKWYNKEKLNQGLKEDRDNSNIEDRGRRDVRRDDDDDEGLIEKIKGWAEKTVLANAINEKHSKRTSGKSKDESKMQDPFNVVRKQGTSRQTKQKAIRQTQCKKAKQRSTKASQQAFREMLQSKISQSKQTCMSTTPQINLITFTTSNSLTQQQKQGYQKQLAHLIKQLKNNDNHGKIRIGKEYYQAKMPEFIVGEEELERVVREKRERLMERKMTVLTF